MAALEQALEMALSDLVVARLAARLELAARPERPGPADRAMPAPVHRAEAPAEALMQGQTARAGPGVEV